MSELVAVESDRKKRIYQILESYGITEKILIDNEAEEMIFTALHRPDIEEVVIDQEGALLIYYSGDTQ